MFAIFRLMVVIGFFLQPVSAGAKSKKPIRLIEGTTVEQQFVSGIAARALTKAGFKFEMVAITDMQALEALTSGAAHAHFSMTDSGDLEMSIKNGDVRSLGGLADNGRDSAVLKIVAASMKKKWPDAQKLIKRMVFSPDTLNAPVAEVRAGKPLADVTAAWFTANRKIWNPWIAASKNWMKP